MEIDWKFVDDHRNDDPAKLLLKFTGRGEGSDNGKIIKDSILQIQCRQKYSGKFPGLFSKLHHFAFPSILSAEQASHLWIAKLHAAIARKYFQPFPHSESQYQYSLVEMTGGLGIDFMLIASELTDKGMGSVCFELDIQKAESLKMNLIEAGLNDAEVRIGDSIAGLQTFQDGSINLIFVDPARRGNGDLRLYNPSDCLPDVVGNMPLLFAKAHIIIIKNSAMLDVKRALEIFPGTVRIYINSVKNECKEVLIVSRKDGEFEGIECNDISGVNEEGDIQYSSFSISADDWKASGDPILMENFDEISADTGYLYEPNASVMKAMPWTPLCRKFSGLKKLSPNCHLFYSENLYSNFPGRILKIESIPDKKMRKELKNSHLNIVTRNYLMRPEEIGRKYGIRPGADRFLYGLTVGSKEHPALVIAQRIG